MKGKLGYLFTSANKFILRKGMSCPSCGYIYADIVDSKYVVTSLRRCRNCQLLFRTPTTVAEDNAEFYQEDYEQGFTTEMPDDERLGLYIGSEFKGTEKDYSTYIEVLEAIGCKPGDRLLDFGSSWGYGSWQLKRYGFVVTSYEISIPRANYAREKLGLKVFSTTNDISGPFDVFFSSHTLEHVPSVSDAINYGMSVLRFGGIFIAFTPNGSMQHRLRDPFSWHRLWGLVHPNFLDDFYYRNRFSDHSLLLTSDPYDIDDNIKKWNQGQNVHAAYDLSGSELLIVAKNG